MFCLKSIKQSVFFLVIFAASLAQAGLISSKPAQLQGTRYCLDSSILEKAPRINFLDEKHQIDRIVVLKKTKELYLLSQGQVYKTYKTAFGFGFLTGNKEKQGDGRTPEGLYHVELKNDRSSYHKALRVSYPNDYDRAYAQKMGFKTGSDIMIHGFPSAAGNDMLKWAIKDSHPKIDWTQGCVAVTDPEIDEIFSLVKVKTPIEICPR